MVYDAIFVRLYTLCAAVLVFLKVFDEELINFALTVVRIIFGRLDENTYMADTICALLCHPYRVAKLLFGAQEVKGGTV